MAATAHEIVYHRRQKLVPVYQKVKKFIGTSQNWGDCESETQDLKGLVVLTLRRCCAVNLI